MAPVAFNIFMIRPSAEAEATALLPRPLPISLPGLEGAQFSLLPTEPHPPAWFTGLAPFLPAPQVPAAEADGSAVSDLERPQSQVPAALLSCRVKNRLLLLAFGAAHLQVKKSLVESHFGRRVAMNAVPPDQVVALQSRQVFATFHRLSERAPGATGHRRFGVDGDRDLVAAVEGLAKKPTNLGERVRGATSLSIEVEPTALPKALAEAVDLFNRPNQFAEWSELDNLVPVTDEAETKQLDALLETYLAARPKDLILAAPWDDELATATQFHIGRQTSKPVLRPLLYPHAFYDSLSGPPTLLDARTTGVHFYDSEKVKLEERTKVFDCICYEATKDKRSYVLWSGRWYETNINFAKRIRARVKQLAAPKHALPPWNGTENEGDFNKRAGGKTGFKNLDKKLVHFGGGQSKFEHCDILHEKSQTLYFVKQYSASSTMSHLVEQVRRTAELFFGRDPAYRAKMSKAGLKVPKNFPRHGDWTLCLVVMGRDLDKLPLFAQCGIARLVAELERNQHSVVAQRV